MKTYGRYRVDYHLETPETEEDPPLYITKYSIVWANDEVDAMHAISRELKRWEWTFAPNTLISVDGANQLNQQEGATPPHPDAGYGPKMPGRAGAIR